MNTPTRAIATGLAACSTPDGEKVKGDGGVVSLNDATPKPSATGGSSRELAVAMVKCLGEADIPAEVGQALETPFVQITYTEGAYFECGPMGCAYQSGESGVPSEQDQRQLAKDYGVAPEREGGSTEAEMALSPVLILGLKDSSEAYAACYKTTGYVPASEVEDTEEQFKTRQQVGIAGANWAACARENGVPNAKDPLPAKFGDIDFVPTALVPTSITKEQVAALQKTCPTMDQRWLPDQEPASEDAVADAQIYPKVGLDVPGFNGDANKAAEALEALDEAALARYGDLMVLLSPGNDQGLADPNG